MLEWNRRDLRGLAINIALSISVAVLANVFILLLNPTEDTAPATQPFQPPGYVIGLVWVGLFLLLGAARWLVIGAGNRPWQHTFWVWSLLLFCAAYPIYTVGLKSLVVGLAGNILTALLAIYVALRIRKTSALAAGFVSTVALWVTFASFLIVEQMKNRPS